MSLSLQLGWAISCIQQLLAQLQPLEPSHTSSGVAPWSVALGSKHNAWPHNLRTILLPSQTERRKKRKYLLLWLLWKDVSCEEMQLSKHSLRRNPKVTEGHRLRCSRCLSLSPQPPAVTLCRGSRVSPSECSLQRVGSTLTPRWPAAARGRSC